MSKKTTVQITIKNGQTQTAQERDEMIRWLWHIVNYLAVEPYTLARMFKATYGIPNKQKVAK